jgi:hypothetical protein
MDFGAITDRALAIRALYDEHERRTYGREWSTEELALGLSETSETSRRSSRHGKACAQSTV